MTKLFLSRVFTRKYKKYIFILFDINFANIIEYNYSGLTWNTTLNDLC